MTTAARPTFDPAKGGSGVREKSLGKLSQQLSSRDLPAHLTLKERIPGQDTVDEVNERDLKAELEEREHIALLEKPKWSFRFVPSLEQTTSRSKLALIGAQQERNDAETTATDNVRTISNTETYDLEQDKCPKIVNARKMAELDADEDFGSVDLSRSDFDDDDIDDEEDDSDELKAELERIKRERQEEEEKRNKELRDKEEVTRSSDSRSAVASNFTIKRRWDDDVPFKNCAREEPDPKRKLYVNDTLRQEFHRRFMDKYIR